jgi:hypothetical protein
VRGQDGSLAGCECMKGDCVNECDVKTMEKCHKALCNACSGDNPLSLEMS